MVNRKSWVIELGTSYTNAPLYLTLENKAVTWARDVTRTLRFSRRVDAEEFAKAFVNENSLRFKEIVTEEDPKRGEAA